MAEMSRLAIAERAAISLEREDPTPMARTFGWMTPNQHHMRLLCIYARALVHYYTPARQHASAQHARE